MKLKKSKKANLERKRLYYLEFGLIFVLMAVYVTINLSFADAKPNILGQVAPKNIDNDIIPVTLQPKKPLPPPPKPKTTQMKVVKNKTKIKNPVHVFTPETNPNTPIIPVQRPENPVKEKVFAIVERMPAMRDCNDLKKESARKTCTYEKIVADLGKAMKYPQIAKEQNIVGTVYMHFVVNDKGKVTDVKVLKGIAGGKVLDQEAIEMVKSLPDFVPGQQRGKNVSVSYNLPIKFSLGD